MWNTWKLGENQSLCDHPTFTPRKSLVILLLALLSEIKIHAYVSRKGVTIAGSGTRLWILFFFFFFLTFIWLHQVLVVALRIFSGGMWDIVSWPGIEPRSPTLGAQSLNHWTTKEVLRLWILRPGFRYSLCYLFAVCLGKAPLTSPVPQSPHFQMRQTMAPAFSSCCKD